QRLIPMAEKTAMLYYCYRDKFYNKFADDLIRSQSVKKQNLAAEYSS
ncbi:MAG TPA: N-acetyltransferase, partial [Acinetobacter ursingii]|nr:N-acetyltransferase [Acinetobacter ursingii]